MTRESKVGLVIACSFLLLVGIVVASKLKNGDEPGPEHESENKGLAAVTPTPEKKDVKHTEEQKKKDAPGAFPPLHEMKGSNGNVTPANSPPSPSADPMLELLKEKSNQVKEQFPPPAPMANANTVASPLLPLAAQSNDRPLPPLDINNLSGALVLGDAKKQDVPPGELPTFPKAEPKADMPPAPAKKEGDVLQLPAPPKENAPGVPPLKKDEVVTSPFGPKKDSAPTFPLPEKKNDANSTFPALPPLKEPAKNELPPVVNNPLDGPPTFPAAKKDDVITPPSPFTVPPDLRKESSIPPMVNREQPVFPGNGQDNVPIKPAPLDIPFGTKEAPRPINTNDLTKPGIGATSPLPESPPRTIPPLGQELPSTPLLNTNPNNSALTNNIGGIKAAPVVEHTMKATDSRVGESSFAQLSTRLYDTDRYAEALYAYNRSHGDANLNQAIAPGQKLVYPTAPEVLARDYPNLVRNVAPVKIVPPTMTPLPPSSPVIAAVSNPPIGPGRSYVVQSPNGERIRDIAQRALGNADRWTEIYRINQNLNLQPQFPLPAGTRLQLPAN